MVSQAVDDSLRSTLEATVDDVIARLRRELHQRCLSTLHVTRVDHDRDLLGELASQLWAASERSRHFVAHLATVHVVAIDSRHLASEHLVRAEQLGHTVRALLGHLHIVVGDVAAETEVLGVVNLTSGLIHVPDDVAHQRAVHELHGLLVQCWVLLEVQHSAVLDSVDRVAVTVKVGGWQDAVGVIANDGPDHALGKRLTVHAVRSDGSLGGGHLDATLGVVEADEQLAERRDVATDVVLIPDLSKIRAT